MRRISFASAAALAASAMVLAGCQSDSGVDALDLGAQQTAEPVKLSELRMYCPEIQIRTGTAYFNTYERGAKDDPSKIVYQASIADATRKCTTGNGTMNIDVAIAGRIVPGPQGRVGAITMPIRIAVVQGGEVLFSQLYKYPVNIDDTIGATQFIFNEPNITIPAPTQKSVLIFAGYDEGPYDTP